MACIEAERTVAACLRELCASCAGTAAEVLLVYPADRPPRLSRSDHPRVRCLQGPRSALVPELWATGFHASRGSVVAFSTAHCIVRPAWAEALLAALEAGAVGAGGPLEPGPGTCVVDWAVCLLRYSAFLPGAAAAEVTELAGDNAAYRRAALERHAASFANGFWEVDFHRRIRAEGGSLRWVPAAGVEVRGSSRWGTLLRHRFRHGSHSRSFRTHAEGIPRWRALAAAPAVPLLLAGRVLRRSFARRRDRLRALASLPVLLPLASAWALGEVRGALGQNAATVQLPETVA
ncbi:MAG: glycosyltransferase family 2 protein [Longimicrobiaceae bacterium]